MSKTGWIKLHRSMLDNPMWDAEPFTMGQAWIDMLMNANHAPATFYVRRQPVEVERGQLAMSEITMANRWKWSRGKVRRYLQQLEAQCMIVQHKSHLTTIITICNYKDFQEVEGAADTASGTADDTAGGTAGDTAKERKEPATKPGKTPCPHDEIIDLYNEILPELKAVIPSRWKGSQRAKNLAARWSEDKRHQSIDFWRRFFIKLREYSFYMGENDRGWRADLGWLIQRKNFDNMLEKFITDSRK